MKKNEVKGYLEKMKDKYLLQTGLPFNPSKESYAGILMYVSHQEGVSFSDWRLLCSIVFDEVRKLKED
jgi:hypothetical protein